MKRFLSLMLSLMLLCSAMTLPAWADEETEAAAEPAEVVVAVDETPAEPAAPIAAEEPAAPIPEEAPAAAEPEPQPAPEAPVAQEAPAPEAAPVVEEKTAEPAVEEKPAAEPVKEEAPAAEPVKEEAPAAEPVQQEAPAAEPVKEEAPAAEPVKEEEPAAEPAQEEAPVAEPVKEEEPAAEPVQEEAPAAEPVKEEEPAAEPVQEEVPAEVPVEEIPAEEPEAAEPVEEVEAPAEEPEAPVEEAEVEEINAFHTGLAKLSGGDVYADAKCAEPAGSVGAVIVYVTDRVKGEGELSAKDVLKVAVNIEGSVESFYVKYARLTYLSDEEAARHNGRKQDGAVDYRGTKLPPAAFTPAEAEEVTEPAAEEVEAPAAEEVVEQIEEPAVEEIVEPVVEEAEAPAVEEVIEQINEPAAEEIVEPAAEETEAPAVEEAEAPAAEDPMIDTAVIEEPADTTPAENPANPISFEEIEQVEAVEPVETADDPIEIVSQPVSQTVELDKTVKFTVTANNVTDYQWQYSTDGSTYVALPSGQKKKVGSTEFDTTLPNTLVFIQNSTVANTYFFKCVLSNNKYHKETSIVQAFLGADINITKEPEDQKAEVGATVVFSTTATNVNNFQWQYSTNGTMWINVSDIDTQFFTVTSGNTSSLSFEMNSAFVNWRFRCVLTNALTTKETEAVKVELITLTTPVIQNVKVEYGCIVTLTWSGSENANGYYVFYGTTNVQSQAKKKEIHGNPPANTISITGLEYNTTYYFWVQAISDNSQSVLSSSKQVTTGKEPTLTAVAKQKEAKVGDPITINATVNNTYDALWYCWQYSADGANWIRIPDGPNASSYSGVFSTTLTFNATETLLSYSYRLKIAPKTSIPNDLIWYSNAVKITNTSGGNVQVPSVTSTPSLLISPYSTVEYFDFAADGSLTIKWHANESNGKYRVKILLQNTNPGSCYTPTAQSNIVATLLDTTTSNESYTFKLSDMMKAEYAKVWIQAQDQNYSINKMTAQTAFGIHFVPSETVSVSASTSPSISIADMKILDYNWASKGALTVKWSSKNGNGRYTVKAILTDEVPKWTGANAAKSVIWSQNADTMTSFKVTKDQMATAKYMKVWIQAQDVNYSMNGKTASMQFAILLRPNATVNSLNVSSTKVNMVPDSTVNYSISANGDLVIKWSVKEGNGKYNVIGVLATNPVVFHTAQTGAVKKIVNLSNTTATSVTIKKADLNKYIKEGSYIKFVVWAQDANYSLNNVTISREFGFKLK